MAPHSSVLAWRIPGMGEPGGLLSMGLYRVGNAAAAAASKLMCQGNENLKEIKNERTLGCPQGLWH